LRQPLAAVMLPDKVEVVFSLDKAAKLERDHRRRGGAGRATDYAAQAR
jgi:hypothetical protein